MGRSLNGPELDVWGLGMILAEMAFGQEASYELSCGHRPRRLRHVSEAMQGLLAGLLAERPSERLSLPQVMAHQWFEGVDWDALPTDPSLSPVVLRGRRAAVLRVA